jgi:hypothetical protein
MKTRTGLVLAASLGLAACAYFNAMYNAQRSFSRAEHAAERGELSAARTAWIEAIDAAATSYRNHPDSRWADDALLLIARARFRLGEFEPAYAAASAALGAGDEDGTAVEARTIMGAADFRLGRVERARVTLDTAIASTGDALPEAHYWRARARFAAGDPGAWDDLEVASSAGGRIGAESDLEAGRQALAAADTARFGTAVRRLIANTDGARLADSVVMLLDRASPSVGTGGDPAAGIARSPWPTIAREPVELARAGFLARAGDTAAAVTAAMRLAGRATASTAGRARVLAARLDLARVASTDALEAVRATLLPALNDPNARALLRTVRIVEVLLERADRDGQPLALFAAGEMARDELHAPHLARAIFVAYADLVPDAVWAPKALLAAAALAPGTGTGAALADRFASHDANVYVQAVHEGAVPDAYTDAEDRLSRSLTALRRDAFREADQRDIRVSTAVARLDSLAARVRADSLRLVCGTMMDSLALVGVRADSVRVACLRGDTTRVNEVLRMDTLLLRDTMRVDTMFVDTMGIDTMDAGRPGRIMRDIFPFPFRPR